MVKHIFLSNSHCKEKINYTIYFKYLTCFTQFNLCCFFNIKKIIQNVWPGLFLLLYYNFFPITLIYFRSKCTYFFSNVLNILHNVKILILLHIVLQKIYILFILW